VKIIKLLEQVTKCVVLGKANSFSHGIRCTNQKHTKIEFH
jgi:hypothetical protein